MSYLERYLSILNKSQVNEIRRQIERRARAGQIRTQEQFNRDLADAIAAVTVDNKPTTAAAPIVTALERTNADVYNDFCSSVLVDLRALYRESNYSDFLIGLEESHSKDFTDTVNVSIRNIRGQLVSKRESYRQAGAFPSVFFEAFDDPATRVLKNVELYNGILRLSRRLAQNRVFDIESVKLLRYPRSGVTYVTSSEFNPEENPKVLSPGSFSGYWAETALCDAMPVLKFQNDAEIPTNETFSGILVVARITFTTPISLNSLNIDPYTEFPIEIPWLRYRVTRNGNWDFITSDGNRFRTSSQKLITLDNLDRFTASVIEIPILQKNASMINSVIPVREEQQLAFLQDVLAKDLRELEYELDKYLTVKSTNISYKKAIAQILKSESIETSLTNVFDIVGIGKKPITTSSLGLIGLDSECPACTTPVQTFDKSLKNSFVYGLFGISPLSVTYNRIGTYRSPAFDNVSKQIISASLDADFETPDITTANFFVESDSGLKYPLVPDGLQRIRERIPIGKEIIGYPKGYFTDDLAFNEFIPNRSSADPVSLNRLFPSFFMKSPINDSTVSVYRNGVKVPFGGLKIDPDEHHIDMYISGDNPLFAPLGYEDAVTIEYTLDAEYESPRHLRFNSVVINQSGDIIVSIGDVNEINLTKNYSVHAANSTTQWYSLEDHEFYIDDNSLVISGAPVAAKVGTLDALSIDFSFYSFDPDAKGNIGRRDFSGSPYRIDLLSSITKRIRSSTSFTIETTRFTGKYKLNNYIIELDHSPIIDYNRYNYDGTWGTDPATGTTYIPILVQIGSNSNPITAIDVTPYKSDIVPYLAPYEEIGFYQYYIRDNVLYFNTKNSPHDITISYEHSGVSVRLLIELSSNRPGASDYTPIVKDYTLRLGRI